MDLQRRANPLEMAAVMNETTWVFLHIGAWFTHRSVSNWTYYHQQGGTNLKSIVIMTTVKHLTPERSMGHRINPDVAAIQFPWTLVSLRSGRVGWPRRRPYCATDQVNHFYGIDEVFYIPFTLEYLPFGHERL